jgi:hypothetical protein
MNTKKDSLVNTSKSTQTDINTQAKELCNLGICVSMAEARRVISTLPPKRFAQIVEKKTKESTPPKP